VLVGTRFEHDESFTDRAENNNCLDDYCWNHGVIGLAGHGEALQFEKGILMETYFNGYGTGCKDKDVHIGCTSGESHVKLKLCGTQSVLVEVLDRPCEYNIGAIENNMIALSGISESMGMQKADEWTIFAMRKVDEWKMFVITHINGVLGMYNDLYYIRKPKRQMILVTGVPDMKVDFKKEMTSRCDVIRRANWSKTLINLFQ